LLEFDSIPDLNSILVVIDSLSMMKPIKKNPTGIITKARDEIPGKKG
jgi:hypothetical protein